MTKKPQSRRSLWICLGMAAAVTSVFWPVHRFEFINLDDPVYVTDNHIVRQGLTPAGVTWAFTALEAQFWHPLTWLSHMVDVEVFGLWAGGHHLTNLALHVVNTLLVFVVLRRLTGAEWRSAVAAGLFGLHPLHVETVAWVADRKDVLSTVFWLLTVWAYTRYVSKLEDRGPTRSNPQPAAVPRALASRFYWMALGFFVLGLMAKPMVVTLPFVLLLLDYWPLGRLTGGKWEVGSGKKEHPVTRHLSPVTSLVWEKVPFLVVAGVGSVVAYWAQRSEGMVLAEGMPLGVRVGSSLVAYVAYLGKAVWPSGLAVFYPYQMRSAWEVVPAGLALVGVTVWVIRRLAQTPYLAVGWFWYVGTLVPVIGLVQIANHALADRYTYVPLLGVFVIGVWWMGERLVRWKWAGGMLSVLVLVGCTGSSWVQLGHWRDSLSLFQHALKVTKGNALAHNNFGNALLDLGRVTEAIEQYEAALRAKPDYVRARNNLGAARFQVGQVTEAIAQYEEVLRQKPTYLEARNNLGLAFLRQGRLAEARGQYEQVLAVNPRDADAHSNLGVVLLKEGKTEAAERHLREAMRLRPEWPEPQYNWGRALLGQGRWQEAQGYLERAAALKPGDADVRMNLGVALYKQGRVAEAQGQFDEAVRLKPEYGAGREQMERALLEERRARERIGQLERVIAGNPGEVEARAELGDLLYALGEVAGAIEQYEAVIRLKPDHADAGRQLAWALATSGIAAIQNGARAVELAEAAHHISGGKDVRCLDTLAAAYAEAGRFDDAARTAQNAIELAKVAGQAALARWIEERLRLYQANQPYREKAAGSP